MIEMEPNDARGTFAAYLAEPAEPATAAITVIQEAFGRNAGIRRRRDLLAEAGYMAIEPDLYSRAEPDIEFNSDTNEQADLGMKLVGDSDSDQAVRAIRRRSRRPGDGCPRQRSRCARLLHRGAAGLHDRCWLTDVDATVSHYGVGIETLLDEMGAIANPLLLPSATTTSTFTQRRRDASGSRSTTIPSRGHLFEARAVLWPQTLPRLVTDGSRSPL